MLHLPRDTGLDAAVQPRGYRLLPKIPRLPEPVADHVVARFGNLQKIMRASVADLVEVEGVGEARARAIKDGLARLAETSHPRALRLASRYLWSGRIRCGGSIAHPSVPAGPPPPSARRTLPRMAALRKVPSPKSRSSASRSPARTARRSRRSTPDPRACHRPALVLHPDVMGLRPLFEDLCRRLATHGLAVCAPEPFARLHADGRRPERRRGAHGAWCRTSTTPRSSGT